MGSGNDPDSFRDRRRRLRRIRVTRPNLINNEAGNRDKGRRVVETTDLHILRNGISTAEMRSPSRLKNDNPFPGLPFI